MPLTATGVVLHGCGRPIALPQVFGAVDDPSPSSPLSLLPQQSTPPVDSTAQVCCPPAATPATPLAPPPAGLMVQLKLVLLAGPDASCAFMLTVDTPGVSGVPVIRPVLGLIVRPAGRPV